MIPTTKLTVPNGDLSAVIRRSRRPEERAFLTQLSIDYPEPGTIPARGAKKGPDVIGVPMPSACDPDQLTGPEVLYILGARCSTHRQMVRALNVLPFGLQFDDDDQLEWVTRGNQKVTQVRIANVLEQVIPGFQVEPGQEAAKPEPDPEPEAPEEKPDDHVEAVVDEEE